MFQNAITNNLRRVHASSNSDEGQGIPFRDFTRQLSREINDNSSIEDWDGENIQKIAHAARRKEAEMSLKTGKVTPEKARKLKTAQSTVTLSLTKSEFWARKLINPTGKFHNFWDLVVVFALLFTATVTPYEVAFLQTEMNLLFYVNRLIDVIFVLDIGVNFTTPIRHRSSGWLIRHRDIASNYFWSGNLFIDSIAILPFEIVGVLTDNQTVERFRIFRIVRLLRLTKLLRIFRASRILKRWEARVSINYSVLTLAKFMVSMLALAHWLACVFGIVPSLEESENDPINFPEGNWIVSYFESNLGRTRREYSPFSQYIASLYWAVMTVTTIGYGDVVAKTDVERLVSVLAMMVGGSMYAYIVGAVCGIVASMDEQTGNFHRTIDDLNRFMFTSDLPAPLKIKIRSFFYNAQHLERTKHFNILMEDMSPDLRGEVALILNAKFLENLPIVTRCHDDEKHNVVTALAVVLKSVAYPPQENIMRPGQMATEVHIIKRGVVALNKSSIVPPSAAALQANAPAVPIHYILSSINQEIMTQGMCFGNDMIITGARRRYSAVSLTFCEVHILTKAALTKVFSENYFPKTAKNLRNYAIKMAFQIKFVQAARMINAKRRSRPPAEWRTPLHSAREVVKKESNEAPTAPTEQIVALACKSEENKLPKLNSRPPASERLSQATIVSEQTGDVIIERLGDVMMILEDLSRRLRAVEEQRDPNYHH